MIGDQNMELSLNLFNYNEDRSAVQRNHRGGKKAKKSKEKPNKKILNRKLDQAMIVAIAEENDISPEELMSMNHKKFL